MSSPLDRIKDLSAEAPDATEFAGLRTTADARLRDALELGPEVWRVLAKCHNMRNVSEYEGALDLNERVVVDLLDACDAVRAKIDALPALA